MGQKLSKRKHPRLKDYDYSSDGAYFITICTHERKCTLSRIVGRGLAPAEVVYTDFGRIAEKQLFALEDRYPSLKIDKYVIMPNHIHVIFAVENQTAGASPRPTIMDMVCSFKSLTTAECKKIRSVERIFQSSFYEHVIRNYKDYEKTVDYIFDNPARWQFDKLYSEE